MLTCDLILISGKCIMNEGMLTGETVPVLKNAYLKGSSLKQSNIMFSGTRVVVSKNKDTKAIGVAINIGFDTIKGQMVLNILSDQPEETKFETDAFKFLGIMFFITILGFIWNVIY